MLFINLSFDIFVIHNFLLVKFSNERFLFSHIFGSILCHHITLYVIRFLKDIFKDIFSTKNCPIGFNWLFLVYNQVMVTEIKDENQELDQLVNATTEVPRDHNKQS